MPACEKCWRDAGIIAAVGVEDKVAVYHRLIEARKDDPCTPEEQCGEMHLVLDWVDGTRYCRCGKVPDESLV